MGHDPFMMVHCYLRVTTHRIVTKLGVATQLRTTDSLNNQRRGFKIGGPRPHVGPTLTTAVPRAGSFYYWGHDPHGPRLGTGVVAQNELGSIDTVTHVDSIIY